MCTCHPAEETGTSLGLAGQSEQPLRWVPGWRDTLSQRGGGLHRKNNAWECLMAPMCMHTHTLAHICTCTHKYTHIEERKERREGGEEEGREEWRERSRYCGSEIKFFKNCCFIVVKFLFIYLFLRNTVGENGTFSFLYPIAAHWWIPNQTFYSTFIYLEASLDNKL